MREKLVVTKQLLAISPETCGDVFSLLDQTLGDAIVLVQKYRLIKGVDIAIWQRQDDRNARRSVWATGPIWTIGKFDLPSQISISNDKTVPRSVRIEQALAVAEQRPTLKTEELALAWAGSSVCTVEITEFHHVREMVDSLRDGCQDALGEDSIVWLRYLHGEKFDLVTKSWGGLIENEKYWCTMNQILQIAGIDCLPPRYRT